MMRLCECACLLLLLCHARMTFEIVYTHLLMRMYRDGVISGDRVCEKEGPNLPIALGGGGGEAPSGESTAPAAFLPFRGERSFKEFRPLILQPGLRPCMAAGRRDSRVKEIRETTRFVLVSRRRPRYHVDSYRTSSQPPSWTTTPLICLPRTRGTLVQRRLLRSWRAAVLSTLRGALRRPLPSSTRY
jgi:hypothetical protein